MPLSFLLDENIRGPLWSAIRQHNRQGAYIVDVVRVGDAPDLPLGSADSDVLLWAEREARILITFDETTMATHLADHLLVGHHSPGVLVIRPNVPIPQIVFVLALIGHAGKVVDFKKRIEYIP
jgi:hypothetical protein